MKQYSHAALPHDGRPRNVIYGFIITELMTVKFDQNDMPPADVEEAVTVSIWF